MVTVMWFLNVLWQSKSIAKTLLLLKKVFVLSSQKSNNFDNVVEKQINRKKYYLAK